MKFSLHLEGDVHENGELFALLAGGVHAVTFREVVAPRTEPSSDTPDEEPKASETGGSEPIPSSAEYDPNHRPLGEPAEGKSRRNSDEKAEDDKLLELAGGDEGRVNDALKHGRKAAMEMLEHSAAKRGNISDSPEDRKDPAAEPGAGGEAIADDLDLEGARKILTPLIEEHGADGIRAAFIESVGKAKLTDMEPGEYAVATRAAVAATSG